jgi:hypothetical protein
MRKHEAEMGAKRKQLYAQYGYDVKYASHAIRLTHQLGDILTEGRIVFPYPAELVTVIKAIKTGQVTLAEFDILYAQSLTKVEAIIADTAIHKVQENVDYNLVAEILENTFSTLWSK